MIFIVALDVLDSARELPISVQLIIVAFMSTMALTMVSVDINGLAFRSEVLAMLNKCLLNIVRVECSGDIGVTNCCLRCTLD